tara:strand:- start:89 stop:490 length:402 start_codon:yes stop_codon:yes gene_type:complete
MIGCDNGLTQPEGSEYYLEASAPDLELDENGYYHIEWIDGYVQTFSTLSAQTGSYDNYQKVGWISNKEIKILGHWTNLVNSSSYTSGGVAHTVLGVWEQFIGDTIKVYSAFQDEYGKQYTDSIGVIVEDEIQN